MVLIALRFMVFGGAGYKEVQCSNVKSDTFSFFSNRTESLTSLSEAIPVETIIGKLNLARDSFGRDGNHSKR